jgi:hypothetical protein
MAALGQDRVLFAAKPAASLAGVVLLAQRCRAQLILGVDVAGYSRLTGLHIKPGSDGFKVVWFASPPAWSA